MSMHFLSFMRAREGRDPKAFQEWYLGDFAPRLGRDHPKLQRHLVNVCGAGPIELRTVHDSDDPRARYEVVDEMWFDSPDDFRRALLGPAARELAESIDVMNCYRVSDTAGRRVQAAAGASVLRGPAGRGGKATLGPPRQAGSAGACRHDKLPATLGGGGADAWNAQGPWHLATVLPELRRACAALL